MARFDTQDSLAMIECVTGLDPSTYQRSSLHADDRIWPEKNCYIDIWIEVLHALRLEPRAIMPFVLGLDFEGDQWTFFKPPHGEIYELYGLDVQELTVWKPLLEHAREHLPAGRLISTESDAYWLPDTAGTDYRRNHVKTTIVVNAIDVENQRMDYFHNGSYHRMEGEDFRQLFQIGLPNHSTHLPLFAEFIRIERRKDLPTLELARASRELVARHLSRRPRINPISRFAERFEADLPVLHQKGLDYYHQWAFGTLRQLGAAFELAAINLRWLSEQGVLHARIAPGAFESLSNTCKALVLKGARAVNAKRALDIATPAASMADEWSRGMEDLQQSLG
jgi:hypothetical protein